MICDRSVIQTYIIIRNLWQNIKERNWHFVNMITLRESLRIGCYFLLMLFILSSLIVKVHHKYIIAVTTAVFNKCNFVRVCVLSNPVCPPRWACSCWIHSLLFCIIVNSRNFEIIWQKINSDENYDKLLERLELTVSGG